MEKIVDLHIHTTFSDGVLTPEEVIDNASISNVSLISIADHDNIDAYSEEFYAYAKKNKIEIITAVEISTHNKDTGTGIHVLGYNFDIHNQELIHKLTLLKNSRHDYLHNVATKLKELNYVLNVEKLSQIKIVTKAHIANDIIDNPQNKKTLLNAFNHIPKMGEFIETIMNEQCPAYVKKESITPKEAADLIRKAGGKVVLAHPVAYQYEDNLTDEEIIKIIDDMQADGIESNYIYIDKNNNKINDINKWNKIARDKNLFTTIGSDFHKEDGLHPQIGLLNEKIKYINLDKIKNNLCSNS